MRRALLVAATALSFLLAAPPTINAASPVLNGWSADDATLFARFDAAIHPDALSNWMKRLASEPNHVGSPHDRANAEWILAQFKSWGWDAHIESFDVLYPTPIHETLEMVSPHRFRATLQEPPIPGDTSAHAREAALPAYLAYQGDGDVRGDLVYVNYGMKDDYDTLERLGVSVKGRIVIARYGHGWRGLKPKLAWQHGAIGCIIYSDPYDDGYRQGDVYPKGAFRPEQGVQRGSVADMPIYPGDPLTPGKGSPTSPGRFNLADAKTVLKIPVLPISYGDAKPLLEALGGEVVPEGWRGALPFTYHIGPGPTQVHLKVINNWDQKPIYD